MCLLVTIIMVTYIILKLIVRELALSSIRLLLHIPLLLLQYLLKISGPPTFAHHNPEALGLLYQVHSSVLYINIQVSALNQILLSCQSIL